MTKQEFYNELLDDFHEDLLEMEFDRDGHLVIKRVSWKTNPWIRILNDFNCVVDYDASFLDEPVTETYDSLYEDVIKHLL